jgi:arginine utilization protein RocB
MKTLKRQFSLIGLSYTLFKLNDKVALDGIGEFTDKILHWEVDIIYFRKDKYGVRKHIAKNDDFGRDRTRCFINGGLALE